MVQSKNRKKYFNLYKVVKKSKKEQIVEGNTWFFYSKYGLGITGILLAINNQMILSSIVFVALATTMWLFYRGSGDIMKDINPQTNSSLKSVDKVGRQYSFKNPRKYILIYK